MDRNCTEYLFDWSEVLRRTDNGQREFDVAVTAITQTAGLTGATREVRKSYRIKRNQLSRLVWKPAGEFQQLKELPPANQSRRVSHDG